MSHRYSGLVACALSLFAPDHPAYLFLWEVGSLFHRVQEMLLGPAGPTLS